MPANKLLSYPHDVFLMVRLEFVQICGDELEAKILRVIERYVDEERTRLFQEAVNKAEGTSEQVMTITKDVWVSISYRLFMSDLFGTIASENTIKKAINSLLEKKIIFRRFDKKNRYDAPEYRIHIPVVQMLLDVVGKSGYQKLIPSIIDTLKNLPPHEMTPSECQNLMLSSQSRVSEIDTNYNKGNDNNTGNNREREVADATARSQTSSQNDSGEDTEKREAVKASTPVQEVTQGVHKRHTNIVQQPPAPRKPPANPVPRRPKQQGIVLMDEIPGDAIPEKAIAIMDRWDRVHKKPAPRTIKTIQAAQLLMVYDPSEDELRDCEKWLYTTDRPGKPWYRSHGVHLPDIAEKIGSWQSLQNAPPPKPEKEISNEHKASSFYTLDALIERQNQWKTEGVTS